MKGSNFIGSMMSRRWNNWGNLVSKTLRRTSVKDNSQTMRTTRKRKQSVPQDLSAQTMRTVKDSPFRRVSGTNKSGLIYAGSHKGIYVGGTPETRTARIP